MSPHETTSWREVEEAFDHRRDGVAAASHFTEKLRWHVAVFGDGKSGTSYCTLLSRLVQAERRLAR